jgi:radical SAM superfamily enzyme YgiQ (UPF0313 family)
MRVLLAAVNAKYIHTALAVRTLAAYVNDKDVSYAEFTINERLEDVLKSIYEYHADTVMFSCYIWNIEFILKTASSLKKLSPRTKIVLGGPEVSFDSRYYMDKYDFIDGIICGEGEETLAEFLEKGFEVNGMVFRDGEKITVMPMRQPICDLNSVPFPYSDDDISRDKDKLIYYESSRGCPFRCSYCLSSTSHNVRFRDLDIVKNELMHFVNCGARIIKFTDRTFNADKKRAVDLVRFLINNGGETQFHFEVAADILSDEMISLFQSAPKGMFLLEIGVQSTNEQTIAAIDRTTDFEKIAAAVKLLKGYVHMHLDLIAGLPYESFELFKKSFNDVIELSPDVLQLGFLKLLRGTKIRNEYKEHGYVFTDNPPYEVLKNDYISYDEILRLKAVENVLERYYNSGNFENAIKYLLKKYDSPFELFDSLGKYFEENGYLTVGISQNRLYEILAAFCGDALFRDYLKLDFFLNTHNPSTPPWAATPFDKSLLKMRFDILTEDFINRYLPEYAGMSVKEIIKHVQLERFSYDVLGGGKKDDNVILFDKKHKKAVSTGGYDNG